jgi:hypothetical protein
MFKSSSILILAMLILLQSCGDNNDGTEFSFTRSIQNPRIEKTCLENSEISECYLLMWEAPINTKNLKRVHIWLDTLVIGLEEERVSDNEKKSSIKVEFDKNADVLDTLDISAYLQDVDFFENRDSVHIAIWAEYSDDSRDGQIKRTFVILTDDMPPARVQVSYKVTDSEMIISWGRPTDQVDFYKPEISNGMMTGYNFHLESDDGFDLSAINWEMQNYPVDDSLITENERYLRSLRELSIKTITPNNLVDYQKDLWLRIADGKGFSEGGDNTFRLRLYGFKPQTSFTLQISAFDSIGNNQASEKLFIRMTDDVKPLMPRQIKGFQVLENNSVLVFRWVALDPNTNDGQVDYAGLDSSEIKTNCLGCFTNVMEYRLFRASETGWNSLYRNGSRLDADYARFSQVGNEFVADASGNIIADTLRYVLPGDTLDLLILASDLSGYESDSLFARIVVDEIGLEGISCPENMVPLKTKDGSLFCMDRTEQIKSGNNLYRNIMWQDAREVCLQKNDTTSLGLFYDLCSESQWVRACDAGGRSQYGVIEYEDVDVPSFLYMECNTGTGDYLSAGLLDQHSERCVSPEGIYDLPGQLQEWVLDSFYLNEVEPLAPIGTTPRYMGKMVKGASYMDYEGIENQQLSKCTARSAGLFSKRSLLLRSLSGALSNPGLNESPATSGWSTLNLLDQSIPVAKADASKWFYRFHKNGVRDTFLVFSAADSLYSFYDSLSLAQATDSIVIFDVRRTAASAQSLGVDWHPISEIRKSPLYLSRISEGLSYRPLWIEPVLLGRPATVPAGEFYRSPSIGFRCCAR